MVGAAVSPPVSCNVRPRHVYSVAGRIRAWQSRKSWAESTPPIALMSAAMLAAISPS